MVTSVLHLLCAGPNGQEGCDLLIFTPADLFAVLPGQGCSRALPAAKRHSGVINAVFRPIGIMASPEEWTFAEAPQGQGYHTAMFGKWHLGYRAVFNPIHHGFEVFKGHVSGNVDYHAHIDRMGVQDWWQNDLVADKPVTPPN